MSADTWYLGTAVACSLLGLLLGLLVPDLIARIPEPSPDTESPSDEAGETPHKVPDEGTRTDGSSEAGVAVQPGPKEPYAVIGRLPGLRWKAAVATAVISGLIGGRVGWDPGLPILLFLAPVGVALALVDWRTRLLPTRVIAPSYAVVALLALVASALSGDWDSLVRAGLGWLVAGGTFFVLWFVYPRGMGYGDVRLSGVLGIALGWLGWAELLTGVYAGFLLGGVGGLLLSVLRIVDRKAYPFGPFMLVGALVGVLAGPYVAAWYV